MDPKDWRLWEGIGCRGHWRGWSVTSVITLLEHKVRLRCRFIKTASPMSLHRKPKEKWRVWGASTRSGLGSKSVQDVLAADGQLEAAREENLRALSMTPEPCFGPVLFNRIAGRRASLAGKQVCSFHVQG